MLAIDVAGSVAQGKLDMLRTIGLAGLLACGLFTSWKFSNAVVAWSATGGSLKQAGFTPLDSAILFFGIILAGAVSLIGAPMMEEHRRKYAYAAIALATVGTISPFIYYAVKNVAMPSASLVVNFCASISVAIGMLVLIALSGFREK